MTGTADATQEAQGAQPAANAVARTLVVLPSELAAAEHVWRPWLDAWAVSHGADTAPIIAAVRDRQPARAADGAGRDGLKHFLHLRRTCFCVQDWLA